MESTDAASALAGLGLEGDRHGRKGGGRQVLVVDVAVLAAEGLAHGAIRENLTVEGIAVDALPAGRSSASAGSPSSGPRARAGPAIAWTRSGPASRRDSAGGAGPSSRCWRGG